MHSLGYPLRLTNGFLCRAEEPEAILALIRVMAMTPSGSWPGCPAFGIRDLLEAALTKSNVNLEVSVQKANGGLQALGIHNYWLENLELEQGSVPGMGVFNAVVRCHGGSRDSWCAKLCAQAS